jgi:transglutaminase-like putative cysteine protease
MEGEPSREGAISFRIRFTFTAYETRTDIDPSDVQPYDEGGLLYTQYARPERFIEAGDPEIVELATQAANGETNPYLLAHRFYDYVVDTAQYELLGEGLRGANALVETGVGECGDYAALFVALCRSAGVPVRPVVGYWAISGIEQTHVWAEFFVEPFGWIPVDPTVGQLDPAKREYYFGAMDNERVILNKGFNIQLYPPGPDDYSAPFLQVPLWWFWGSSGDADSVSIERTSWTVERIP